MINWRCNCRHQYRNTSDIYTKCPTFTERRTFYLSLHDLMFDILLLKAVCWESSCFPVASCSVIAMKCLRACITNPLTLVKRHCICKSLRGWVKTTSYNINHSDLTSFKKRKCNCTLCILLNKTWQYLACMRLKWNGWNSWTKHLALTQCQCHWQRSTAEKPGACWSCQDAILWT